MSFNIISGTLIYLAPILISLLYLVGLLGKRFLQPTFRHQWLFTAVAWTVILPLHLQMSGWGVTPGIPSLIGAQNFPFYNIYNVPQPTVLWGLPYDWGFFNTSIMHAVAGFLFMLTFDLFVGWVQFWKQAFITSYFTTVLLNVWKINELINHFNGSPIDTQLDWLLQNIAILFTMTFLYLWDRHE